MKIQVILGSIRPGRVGERVAKWVTAAASDQLGFDVELVDLADFKLGHFDEAISPRFNPSRRPSPEAKRWLDKVGEADGYIIVTSEYNHSVPSSLKAALDFLDFQFVKKPVAIVSYGTVGGARAAEQLKLIVTEVKAALVPEALAIIGAKDLINEQGKLLAGDDSYQSQTLRQMLTELEWWTVTLKAGREQLAEV